MAEVPVTDGAKQRADDDALHEMQNELGNVSLCRCGGVNLKIGPVTWHFRMDDIDLLLDLARGAKEISRGISQRQQSRKKKRRGHKPAGLLH